MAISPANRSSFLTYPISSRIISMQSANRVSSVSGLFDYTGSQGNLGVSGVFGNEAGGLGAISGLSGLGFDSSIRTVSDLAKYLYDNGFKANQTEGVEGAKDYLTTIKSASQSMKDALSALTGTSRQSAFKQLSPASSDTSKLTLEYTSNSVSAFNTFDVHIDQIASKQVNKGSALAADSSLGSPALFEFKIQNDGKEYNFFVNTDASDTNATLQDKIAKAINDKGIGVTALVEKNEGEKSSTLTIQSKETGTGEKNKFTITDVYGDAVSRTGIDHVTAQAKDAVYRINDGAQITSQSNTVLLSNGLKATFHDTTDDAVQVSMKTDASAAQRAVSQMAQSYNDLIAAAKSSDTSKALQLNYQLASVVNTYAPSLNRIGIEMDTNGKMTVNAEKLNSAAESGALQSFFNQGGYSNYGFANRLSSLATDIQTNPMKYTDLSNFGYANFNYNPYSPFQNSRYSQVYTSGLFLNMFA